jgi:hypothetical protein
LARVALAAFGTRSKWTWVAIVGALAVRGTAGCWACRWHSLKPRCTGGTFWIV